jgi:antibiotic biosynthesis monooxygenase (ABM) superfamily enzyme
MATGDPVVEEAHGLEGWFTPPAAQTSVERPTRYKMAILTIVGLYPPIVVLGALVTASTGLPVALGTLVTVTIVAAIATYWVMPWITRVAHHWLFSQS